MLLDPQAQAMLHAMSAMPPIDWSRITAPELRAAMASASFAPGDAVASVEDRRIPGPGGDIGLRIYRPQADAALPVTLFFHGGGFVLCDLDSHDNLCRGLARRAECIVVSVDYRRAPETKFPGAVEDACVALDWARAQAASFGGDPTRLAVAGDSAGGNLAAAAAQHARSEGLALRHQLLLYPITDCGMQTASYREFADGYYLSAAMMRWFLAQYLPDAQSADDPRASPLRSRELGELAPATIFTVGYDPLRDEGEAYAQALAAAGVTTTLRRWPGQIHGFLSMLGMIDEADRALWAAADALRAAFANHPARA